MHSSRIIDKNLLKRRNETIRMTVDRCRTFRLFFLFCRAINQLHKIDTGAGITGELFTSSRGFQRIVAISSLTYVQPLSRGCITRQ